MTKVQFMAGEGRNFQGGVNYLVSDDGRIYAEVKVPEDASDDYGYLTMAYAIQEKADQIGLDLNDYEFWYDGQEDSLEADADAECEVYLEVE